MRRRHLRFGLPVLALLFIGLFVPGLPVPAHATASAPRAADPQAADPSAGDPFAEDPLAAARAASTREDPQAALRAVRRALRDSPEHRGVLEACTSIANWAGDYEQAAECWDRILGLPGLDREERRRASLGRARSVSWSGDADRAAGLLRRHVETYPGDREARRELARAQAWRGNTPAALDVLDELERDFGSCPECRRELAFALSRHQPRAALRVLGELLPSRGESRAGESRPEDEFLRGVEATALAEAGRPAEALENVERLREIAPGEERTRDVARRVETPLSSRVRPSFRYYDDSDSLVRESTAFSGTWSVRPRLRLRAGLESGRFSADLGSGLAALGGRGLHSRAAWLGFEIRLTPDLEVGGRMGPREIDEAILGLHGDGEVLAWELDVRIALGDAVDLGFSRQRDLFDVSPRTLDLGIERDATRYGLTARPTRRLVVDAAVTQSDLTDGNASWDIVLAPRRIVHRSQDWNLDLGLRGRWLEWDRRRTSGYYAPLDYRRYDLTAFAYWKISENRGLAATLALGPYRDETMEDYEIAGDVTLELTLGIYRDWMFRLWGAYSDNGRQATGAFDAFSVAVGLSRRF